MFQTSNRCVGMAIVISGLDSGIPDSYPYYALYISLGPQSYVGNMEY